MRNGFQGGVIVDYPNSKKKKKYFLFLTAGFSEEIYQEAKSVIMPSAKTEDDDESDISEGGTRYKKQEQRIQMFGQQKSKKIQKQKKYHSEHGAYKSKSWIMAKKDRARKQGK